MLHWEEDAYPDVESCKNSILVRIKHYLNRDEDVPHWKFLLSVIDGLTFKNS